MSNILFEIADYTRERYNAIKRRESESSVRQKALSLPKGHFDFQNALASNELSFICEVKKASPSKGLISPDFPYLKIAKEYEQGGANAISCLTEPHWFLGDDKYLHDIINNISLPVLRKDFTVSEYQIFESKLLGASAVLLIVTLLEKSELREYIDICNELGISALVEAHDENEVEVALNTDAKIIGVNNRDLTNFTVDVNNSSRFRQMIPSSVIYVSESGVKTREDVELLRANNTNAVLIGETLMRAENRVALLKEFKGESKNMRS